MRSISTTFPRATDAAAAYERALIRARTKAALAVKKARGESTGTPRYGLSLGGDGKRLVPNRCGRYRPGDRKGERRGQARRESSSICWLTLRMTPATVSSATSSHAVLDRERAVYSPASGVQRSLLLGSESHADASMPARSSPSIRIRPAKNILIPFHSESATRSTRWAREIRSVVSTFPSLPAASAVTVGGVLAVSITHALRSPSTRRRTVYGSRPAHRASPAGSSRSRSAARSTSGASHRGSLPSSVHRAHVATTARWPAQHVTRRRPSESHVLTHALGPGPGVSSASHSGGDGTSATMRGAG